jgi:hypothetical protein
MMEWFQPLDHHSRLSKNRAEMGLGAVLPVLEGSVYPSWSEKCKTVTRQQLERSFPQTDGHSNISNNKNQCPLLRNPKKWLEIQCLMNS